MKILVIGRTGQVARELARAAPQALCLDRAAADLADPDAAAAAVAQADADAVINAAAYTAVDRAEEEEPLATTVNGTSPGAMARAAAARGIPFLHISTDYVFNGSGSAPWAPDDATAPLSAYGRSKLMGEQQVRAAGGTVLRTAWVFSAHGGNFVKTMLRLGAERDQLTIVDDQIGGPTPARAIADALLVMARQLAAGQGGPGVYHLSGAPDVSWASFAAEIFAQTGLNCVIRPIPTRDYPTPAPRPLNSRLDCTSLGTAFGIERPDWRHALEEVLKEIRDAA